jgi:predicted nuclease of predicted toxin-antitoxin system
VKFLVDAQLPRRVANRLRELGHDALHTLDLPDRNRTSDREVNVVALREDRVVITKDADFAIPFFSLVSPTSSS